jgi:hypothetical protein
MAGTADPNFPPGQAADYCGKLIYKSDWVQAYCLAQQNMTGRTTYQPTVDPSSSSPADAAHRELVKHCLEQSWTNQPLAPWCLSLNGFQPPAPSPGS